MTKAYTKTVSVGQTDRTRKFNLLTELTFKSQKHRKSDSRATQVDELSYRCLLNSRQSQKQGLQEQMELPSPKSHSLVGIYPEDSTCQLHSQ